MAKEKKEEKFGWKEVKGKIGHEPTVAIECPFCGTEMVIRFAAAGCAGITGGYANSLTYKCPHCDFTSVFSIPITEEYYIALVEQRGGTNYIPEEEWQRHKEIKERLKTIGYW